MAESIRVNLESPAMGDLINYLEGAIKGIDKFGNVIDEIQKPIESMNKGFTKTMSLWLNLMFLGQNLNKIFGGLRDLIWQTYLNAAFMDLSFGMMAELTPILSPVVDLVYDLINAFYDLPGPLKFIISVFVLLIGLVVAIIPLLTNLVLMNWALTASGMTAAGALAGVAASIGAIGAAVAVILPWIIILAAALLLLGFLWDENFLGVQDKFEEFSIGVTDNLDTLRLAIEDLFAGDWEGFGTKMQEVVDAFQPRVKETREETQKLADLIGKDIDIGKGWNEFISGLQKGWDEFTVDFDLGKGWGEFTTGLIKGWNETVDKVKAKLAEWKKGFDETVEKAKVGWGEFTEKVKTKWDGIVVQVKTKTDEWGRKWDESTKETKKGWDEFTTGLKKGWDETIVKVKSKLAEWKTKFDEKVEGAKKGWSEFTTDLGTKWDTAIDGLKSKLAEWKKGFDETVEKVKNAWGTLTGGGSTPPTSTPKTTTSSQNIGTVVSNAVGAVFEGLKEGAKVFSAALGKWITVDDFIIRPGMAPISINPNDTLIGMKDISTLGSQGNYSQTKVDFSPSISINVSSIASASDINNLKRELNEKLYSDYTRLLGGKL